MFKRSIRVFSIVTVGGIAGNTLFQIHRYNQQPQPLFQTPLKSSTFSIKSNSPKKIELPNQDSYINGENGQLNYWGIFDGHGAEGHNVSNYVSKNVSHLLVEHKYSPLNFVTPFPYSNFLPFSKTYVNHIFQKIQHDLINHQSYAAFCSGSTSLFVISYMCDQKRYFQIISLGDSQVAFFDNDYNLLYHSPSHRPDIQSEKERLLKIKNYKKLVPYKDNPNDTETWIGRLSLSGCFGDTDHDPYITRIPNITTTTFQSCKYIVLASDGFWDFAADKDITTILKNNEHSTIKELSSKLVQVALTNGSDDDITVTVVQII